MRAAAIAGAIGIVLAIAIGFLVWELPQERAPRFVELELEADDQLPGAGKLFADAGVVSWNGSTLRVPARVLYIVPDEPAHVEHDTLFSALVAVHLPDGPATSDNDLLVDHMAEARWKTDDDGFLTWIAIAGVDEVSGRIFTIRTTGTREGRLSRWIELELEAWTPGGPAK